MREMFPEETDSMLEILVTILILAVGMLGLAALQGQAHTSELESYQRAQALILLNDMVEQMGAAPGAKWGDLHLRFKGNSSFNFAGNSLKHSLKLDFNDLDAKASLSGLDKLNLNNDAMDSSGLRETLAYDVFRTAGVAAPRTALAKVYLTVPGQYERTYLGAYTAIEQVDKDFLKDRFGEKGGLLIKPEQNATLGYLGESWSTYESRMGEKVDATAAEGRRFVDFVRLLNQANDEEFARRIGDYVDVDQFLKFVAVQAALVNYDSPLMSGHNYYLYLNPKDHRFVWIPWDQNEAFGSFGVNGANAANMSILEPSAPNSFRMADRRIVSVLEDAGEEGALVAAFRGLAERDAEVGEDAVHLFHDALAHDDAGRVERGLTREVHGATARGDHRVREADGRREFRRVDLPDARPAGRMGALPARPEELHVLRPADVHPDIAADLLPELPVRRVAGAGTRRERPTGSA